MSKFTIPTTIEEATERLVGIESLLTAKGWERAAIIAAFVEVGEPGDNQHGEVVTSDHLMSVRAFAALGIAGLKSKNTVQRYVEAWKATGRERPVPGQAVDVDGLGDFPGTWGTNNVDHTRTQPGNVAAALTDPVFAAKVAERLDDEAIAALVDNPKVREAGYLAVADEAEKIKKEIRPPKIVDDGRRPSEGAVGDGIAYMIETEEIDESLNALIGQTQKVADILRGGGLNVLLADQEVKTEAQEWVANIRQKLAVINATVDVISDVVEAGGVEDPDAAIAKLLNG